MKFLGSPVASGLCFGFKADVVVNSIPESLFAAEIPFSRLDADVPEQELNLFEFSPGLVTQARACSTKIVWRNVRQAATQPVDEARAAFLIEAAENTDMSLLC